MLTRQFTATVYIIRDRKLLFIFHKKLKKWLPPGGHLEPNELPSEGAIREAFEETGFHVELIMQENIWIPPYPNCKSIPRPFLCLCEEIPPFKQDPAHQHIDFIFIGKIVGGSEMRNEAETDQMRWFTLDQLKQLSIGNEIFPDTIEISESILSTFDSQIDTFHLV